MTELSRDRILGAIYGVALGDILGATVEFMSRSEVRRRYPHGHRDIVGGGIWRPGEVTDDTDMTLCVARGIRAAGPDAPIPALVDAIGEQFIAWYDSNPKDVGITIREACVAFRRLGDWDKVAEYMWHAKGEGASGNGSLMRAVPVSLYWPDDSARVAAVSAAQTRMTHPTEQAVWCSVAYNLYVCRLLHGEEPRAAWTAVLADRPLHGPRLDPVSSRFGSGYDTIAGKPEHDISSSGYSVDSLEAALWSFWTTDSAEACIVRAANLGDDADTVAAIAGGLAGAHYGLAALPQRWLDALEREPYKAMAELFG